MEVHQTINGIIRDTVKMAQTDDWSAARRETVTLELIDQLIAAGIGREHKAALSDVFEDHGIVLDLALEDFTTFYYDYFLPRLQSTERDRKDRETIGNAEQYVGLLRDALNTYDKHKSIDSLTGLTPIVEQAGAGLQRVVVPNPFDADGGPFEEPLDIGLYIDNEPPPIDYVLPCMVAGTVGNLSSPGASGKSMFALQLATQIAGGPDLLGLGDYPTGKAVYLPAEDFALAIQHRMHHLWRYVEKEEHKTAIRDNLKVYPLTSFTPNLFDQAWYDAVMRLADGKRLMILDTLSMFHEENENDNAQMKVLVRKMGLVGAETGCSVVFLHHYTKSAALSGNTEQQASRGASALIDNARWGGALNTMTKEDANNRTIPENERRFYACFSIPKVNFAPPFEPIWYKRHDGGVLLPDRYLNEAGEKVDSKKAKAVRLEGKMA